LWLLGSALTLTLFTGEISAYWQVHGTRQASTLAAANSQFAREAMLSSCWALYATMLIVIGLRKKYAPIRYFAITVFGITIIKVFAIDLAELDRIYRVLSVIGLGVALLVTSYLYQQSKKSRRRDEVSHLVHLVRDLLAAGPAGGGPLSARLDPADSLPHPRHCRGRRPRTHRRHRDVSGQAAARSTCSLTSVAV
jgi:hypothetical protein